MLTDNQNRNIITLSFVFLSMNLVLTYFFVNKNPEIALTIIATFALLLISSIVKDYKEIKIGNIIEITKQEIKQEVKEEIKKEVE